jgi:hypothetical protein
MAYLCGAAGFVLVFLMLRKTGSIGRHVLAYILGMILTLFLYGIYVHAIVPPGGNYRSDWLAWVWLVGFVIGSIMQIVAMLIAMFIRRNAAAKAAP